MDRRKFIEGGLALGAVVSVPALAQSSASKWPSQTMNHNHELLQLPYTSCKKSDLQSYLSAHCTKRNK